MPLDFQPEGGGLDFRPETPSPRPARTPFHGTHFSHSEIHGGVVRGALRGSSPESSDAYRVHLGGGAPAGVHVVRDGNLAHPSIHGRPFANQVSGDHAIADIDKPPARDLWAGAFRAAFQTATAGGADPNTAKALAMNTAEHHLRDSGYTGYEASQHQPGQILLFGDVPIDAR